MKTTLSALAVLITMSIAVAHAQERHSSVRPTFAALTGVGQAVPVPQFADRQPQSEPRMTWGDAMSGIPPIGGLLPNGIRENGYN